MIDMYFRSKLPSYVKFCFYFLNKWKVHPNTLSIVACVISLLASISAANHLLLLACFLWWSGRFFDGLDGIWARESAQQSSFGAYLDICLDFVAYTAMILAFSLLWPQYNLAWLLILALYTLCGVSALSLGSLQDGLGINSNEDNRTLRLGAGLAEAGETGIFYSCVLVFPSYLSIWLALWIFILSLTVVLRTVLAKRILRNK